MAQAGVFHLGDVGTQIIVQAQDPPGTVIDISTATGLTLIFKTPQGDVLTKTASLYTDGTDGKLYYAITATDWPIGSKDLAGTWEAQGYYTLGSWTGHTAIFQFTVLDSLA